MKFFMGFIRLSMLVRTFLKGGKTMLIQPTEKATRLISGGWVYITNNIEETK